MFEYKEITKKDKHKWIELVDVVLNHLERKDFFVPFTEDEKEQLFKKSEAINMGAYDGERLVGVAQLYLDETYVKQIKEELDLQKNKVVELGGYLVLEEYRNQGIMRKLEMLLIEKAKKLAYEFMVITVHPENIASNKVVELTGAKLVKTMKLGEYLRNIWVLDLRK